MPKPGRGPTTKPPARCASKVRHFGRIRVPAALDVLIQLDSAAHRTYGEQLYRQLRDAVLSGRLASNLGLVRQTVLETYEQLAAEGYLVARRRRDRWSGTVMPCVRQR